MRHELHQSLHQPVYSVEDFSDSVTTHVCMCLLQAALQAERWKGKDRLQKPTLRDPVWGRYTGGVTLTPEAAEPVHQPGHGAQGVLGAEAVARAAVLDSLL